MWIRRSFVISLAALLCFSPAAASLAESATGTSVRFSLDEHGGIVVPVTVAGKGPLKFLVDTGSSGTTVSTALVAALGAPIVAKADVTTVGGRVTRPVASLRHVTLGGESSEEILAVIVPSDSLASIGSGVLGILGQDFLAAHDYTLDYRHRTLTWEEPNEPARDGDERLPLAELGGQMVVELQQGGADRLRMVPDSGAEALIVFGRPDVRVPLAHPRSSSQVTGITGTRDAASVVVSELRIGSITLRNEPAVAVALPAGDAHQSDGLLPLHYFSSVSFSAAGYVVFRRYLAPLARTFRRRAGPCSSGNTELRETVPVSRAGRSRCCSWR